MPLKKLGELIVSSRLNHLNDVDRFTEKVVHSIPLPDADLDDIAISVSEAVNNAMVHGNKLDDRKKVKIRFYLCSRYLRIVVQDEGAGFSPDKVPDPRSRQNLLKTSGRGILIMSHLMDRVEYKPRKAGMQVVMDKFCPQGCLS